MHSIKKVRSIFSIILIDFFIVVVPIYAAGFMIYKWAVAQVQQEIVSTQSAHTEYYLERFHSDIQRIVNQQSSLSYDKDLTRLCAVDDATASVDTVFAVNRLQTRLSAILASSDMIENVSIYLPSLKRSIHAVGSINDMTMEQYENLVHAAYGNDGQIAFKDQMPVTMIASPRQFTKSGKIPIYLVEVEFSTHKICNALKLMKGNTGGGIALVNEQLKRVVAGTGDFETILNFIRNQKAKTHDAVSSFTEGYPAVEAHQDGEYLVTLHKDAYTGLTLVNYSSIEEIYRPLRKYRPYFQLFTLFVVILAVLFLYIMYRRIKKPLTNLINAFQAVEDGNFTIRITDPNTSEFRYLYSSFQSMLVKVNNLIDQVYKQKILHQKSELKQLQSQINPHFLYNTYFVLYDMTINEDYDNLAEYTKHMGTYFQYITRNSTQTARLCDEVEHARIYANFQAHRFRNRICMCFEELPENLHNMLVPKVILQPVIENVFEHGLKNKVSDGILKISFLQDPFFIDIIVEDNGDELSNESIHELQCQLKSDDIGIECTGLVNIHRRIVLSFGSSSGVFVSRGSLGGLKVVLHIEKRYLEENNVPIIDC